MADANESASTAPSALVDLEAIQLAWLGYEEPQPGCRLLLLNTAAFGAVVVAVVRTRGEGPEGGVVTILAVAVFVALVILVNIRTRRRLRAEKERLAQQATRGAVFLAAIYPRVLEAARRRMAARLRELVVPEGARWEALVEEPVANFAVAPLEGVGVVTPVFREPQGYRVVAFFGTDASVRIVPSDAVRLTGGDELGFVQDLQKGARRVAAWIGRQTERMMVGQEPAEGALGSRILAVADRGLEIELFTWICEYVEELARTGAVPDDAGTLHGLEGLEVTELFYRDMRSLQWRIHGGRTGSLRITLADGRTLEILVTPEVHERIQAEVRRVRGGQG